MNFKNLIMATNNELTSKLALDLGIDIKNRRPSARETFKWLDIDLLPHSSADTLLCEIYEWNSRNWRTTGENLIGEIFTEIELPELKKLLMAVPKELANVPDFEFTKEDLIRARTLLQEGSQRVILEKYKEDFLTALLVLKHL